MGECLIIRSSNGIDIDNTTIAGNVMLEGYTCYSNNGIVMGEIPKIEISKRIHCSDKAIMEYGYYDGTSLVLTDKLDDITISTAVFSDLLEGTNGWSIGINVNGTIPNIGTVTKTFAVNDTYHIPKGWYSNGTVKQTLLSQPTTSTTPTTVNKNICNAGRWTTGDLWVLGNSNLVVSNVKNGVAIFGIVGNFTGWVDNQSNIIVCDKRWHETTYDGPHVDQQYDTTYAQVTFTAKGWSWMRVENTAKLNSRPVLSGIYFRKVNIGTPYTDKNMSNYSNFIRYDLSLIGGSVSGLLPVDTLQAYDWFYSISSFCYQGWTAPPFKVWFTK